MGKSVGGSCDQHSDSRTIKKRSATTSKLAAARGTSREKLVGKELHLNDLFFWYTS